MSELQLQVQVQAQPSVKPPIPFERAYVINLKSATQRWERVMREFRRIGIKPTRVEAVVGAELSSNERAAICTPACAARCTPGMIGCGASHVFRVWKRMLAENVSAALVCEDDVVFVRGFFDKLIAYATEFPPDWDVIYLSCVGCSLNSSSKALMNLLCYTHASENVSEHIWIPPAALTTACYLVSAAGARKLLAHLEGRLHTHIDVMMNTMLGQREINAFAVRPLLASQSLLNEHDTSSIVTSRTPRGPTMLLNQLPFDNDVTWGYAFTAPLAKVGSFTFTGWAPVFFGSGAVCGVLRTSIWGPLVLCLILLCLDILPLLQGDADTGVTVAMSCCIALIGWVGGLCVAAGGSAITA
jgi:GR25 family glycosyltransferase involved in LPS biosynthesis